MSRPRGVSEELNAAGDLPLQLPAPLLGRFAVRTEESTPCSGPFDHPDFIFSVDWDGARTMVVASPGNVLLQSWQQRDISHRFPEIFAAASKLRALDCVIDGVISVLDGKGAPDLVGLGERIASGAASADSMPVAFLATDLLRLEGKSLTSTPLQRRLELLNELQFRDPRIQIPDTVRSEGVALAEAAAARGLAAILARRSDQPYHSGVASPHRLRIALTSRANTVVLNANPIPGVRRRRIRLGEWEGGRLQYTGDIELAESSVEWRWAAPAGFLREGLVATVSHFGRYGEQRLRDPMLLALRDDIDPRWCRRREAVEPPRSYRWQPSGSFRPTVLMPLPLE